MNLRPIPWGWLAKFGVSLAAIYLFESDHPGLHGVLLQLAAVGVCMGTLLAMELFGRTYRAEQLKIRNRRVLERQRRRP